MAAAEVHLNVAAEDAVGEGGDKFSIEVRSPSIVVVGAAGTDGPTVDELAVGHRQRADACVLKRPLVGAGEDEPLHLDRIRRRVGQLEQVAGAVAVEGGNRPGHALVGTVLDAGESAADRERRGDGDGSGRNRLNNRPGDPHLRFVGVAGQRPLRLGERGKGVRPVGAVLEAVRPFADMDDVRAAAVSDVRGKCAGHGRGGVDDDGALSRRCDGDAHVERLAWRVVPKARKRQRLAGLDAARGNRLDHRAAL